MTARRPTTAPVALCGELLLARVALVVGRHVPSGRSVVRTAALRMGRDVAALEFGDLPHLAMEIASVVERSRGRRAAVEVHRAVTALWGHGGAPPAGRSADHAA